jgi:hypothetical protein
MYELVNKIRKKNYFVGSMIGINGYRGPGLVLVLGAAH